MIIEQRTYDLWPGKVPDYMRRYEAQALHIQLKYLGGLLGYYSTEVGPLNQVVHLWGYRDFEDRHTRREAMRADPAWAPYLAQIRPLIVRMENKLLRPAPFFNAEAVLELNGEVTGK